MQIVKKSLVWFCAIIIPIIVAYVYYTFFDAQTSEWSVKCDFHKYTGLLCPGCGGQRSVYLLMHGHFLKALQANAIFVIGIPFFAYLYYVIIDVFILKNKKHLNSFLFSTKTAIIFLIITFTFFILRNIPVFPFTYFTPTL